MRIGFLAACGVLLVSVVVHADTLGPGGRYGLLELGHASGLTLSLSDDIQLMLGTGSDARLEYDTAVTPDTLVLGVGTDSRLFILAETADLGTDWNKAQQTNPTLCVQSADAGTTTDRICLSHNQTDGVLSTDGGQLIIDSASTLDIRDTITNSAGNVAVADTLTATGIIASTRDASTLNAAATSFVVTRNAVDLLCDAGGNTISQITGAATGMFLVIKFGDANCHITDTDDGGANTIDLDETDSSGDNDIDSADDMVLMLYHNGTSWFQVARLSAN